MKAWTSWEIIRHQVAIGGIVATESGERLVAWPVRIVSMPDAFSTRVSAAFCAAEKIWENLEERPDLTLTRGDGTFYFLDLPAGNYTLKVIDPVTGSQDEKESVVEWDKNGRVNRVMVSMRLPISLND
jgi:hypothetical protein